MSTIYKRIGILGSGGGGSTSVKDPVSSFATLPSSGNNPNDLRYVIDVEQWYRWTGTVWENWTTDQTASRVLVTDANKLPVSSSTTTTQLSYLDATSSVQTQLNTGATNLSNHLSDTSDAHDASAISVSSISNLAATDVQAALAELQGDIDTIASPITYKGTYNATTNSPALANSDTGKTGYLYYVLTAGTQDFGAGNITFAVGDKVVNNGTTWDKWDDTSDVVSVNTQTGAVVLNTSHISENTNLYFTDSRAKTAAVADSITDGITDVAPSQNAVFDALALKYDASNPSSYITSSEAITAVVSSSITNGVTNKSPSEDAVFDALALKYDASNPSSFVDASGAVTAVVSSSITNGVTNKSPSEDAVFDALALKYDASNPSSYVDAAGAVTAVVSSSITNGVTNKAPSEDAVFDALALKVNTVTGDIIPTSFSAADNQAVAADVTGLAFSNVVVRSFNAFISCSIIGTANLYEDFNIIGIQKDSEWDISITSSGDNTGVTFSITNAGQIQYTSPATTGFVSNTLKFRALTLSI